MLDKQFQLKYMTKILKKINCEENLRQNLLEKEYKLNIFYTGRGNGYGQI